jgi:hypothetical protein
VGGSDESGDRGWGRRRGKKGFVRIDILSRFCDLVKVVLWLLLT